MTMVELTTEEIREVDGGLAPIIIGGFVAGMFLLGMALAFRRAGV
jgi:lactobin A/cerein 7B family class IIb bacteriocin